MNPPAFSDMALSPEAFAEPRTKQKLVSLFSKIGFDLDEVFQAEFSSWLHLTLKLFFSFEFSEFNPKFLDWASSLQSFLRAPLFAS